LYKVVWLLSRYNYLTN